MKNYVELLGFEIEAKILAGQLVYCLDKHLGEVLNVGTLTVKDYFKIFANSNYRNRYYFWTEEEEETK